MLKKNDTLTVTFTGYTSEGHAVARSADGQAVFVGDAIAGEVAQICIDHVGKTAAHGHIVKLETISPHRVQRECVLGKRCGGCDFWHMDYEEELRLKSARVRDALARIGAWDAGEIAILGAAETKGYRNKAQYPVADGKKGAVAGFYQARTHSVIPVERCLIQSEQADIAKDTILDWMQQYRVQPYREAAHTGLVRHIYVRTASTGQVLVCLVVRDGAVPQLDALLAALQARVEGLCTVVLSVNPKRGNVVLGQEFRNLLGDGTIEETLCGITYRLSARSFFQVNRVQAERLYALALEQAALRPTDIALDLYCGTGTITLLMARRAARVIGVEVIDAAIADARENAARNGIENVEFRCADAGEAAAQLASEGIAPDVIMVDPPRKGLSEDVIAAIAAMSPARLVYVSCDPATLARDIKRLQEKGYTPKTATAVDMFPKCSHVETVVLMSRK